MGKIAMPRDSWNYANEENTFLLTNYKIQKFV